MLRIRRADSIGEHVTPGMSANRPDQPAFLDALNPVQRDAVTTTDGPVMIVAGAGSGKTRVLTYRIAYLLERDVPPWNILALTFTNKAAAEMKERIAELVGDERSRDLWMGTFHSVFSRILRREAERLGFTKSFTIYDTDDSIALIRSSMAEFGISPQDYSPKMVYHRISGAKNAMINPGAYRSAASNALEERVGLLYDNYQSKLRACNAMDFDDLLVRTIELFEKHPDVAGVYRERFHYILIDEYQDTNRAQYIVVRELARGHGNVCVVGDDAQSIYSFRGADIRNMLDFERDYAEHRAFRLEQNYRSTQRILAAAEDVIRHNRDRIDKQLWTENQQGERVCVVTARDEREEGEEVLRIIRRHVSGGTSLGKIAVLYRTNSQSLSIEDALRRANIPYGLVGGVAFYRRKEVKEAMAYLRLAVNPRDDESFIRAVNTPARGIGETSIKRLRLHAQREGVPLAAAARTPEQIEGLTPRVGNALSKFIAVIDQAHESVVDESAPAIARELIVASGLLESYRSEGTPEAIARWDNVQRVLSHIAEWSEGRDSAGLDEYLQEISLLSDVDSFDPDAERVTLMTVHSSKGLEFDVVVVVGMEDGLFPIGTASQEREELEEERRLFYVAVTRARQRLYLTNCERRYRFGELSYPIPSRFLNEIDEEHLEFSSLSIRPVHRAPTEGHIVEKRQALWKKSAIDQIPEDDYSQEPRELNVGVTVIHPTFGRGSVEAIGGSGEKVTVTVRFQVAGRKQLMLKFANLRIV